MVSLRRPSTEAIREFLASQSKLGFTYMAVGATASQPPAGYVVDHTRIKLGEGEEVFTKAKAALRRWEQFRLGWVEAWPPETPIQTGEVVAVIARNVGLWWLNACRIVYVVDDPGPIQRYGFAYGTLPDHAENGRGAIPRRMGSCKRRGLVRHPGVLPPTTALDLAGVSIYCGGSRSGSGGSRRQRC